MSISSLPTDSLYKFGALGGILLLIAAVALGNYGTELAEEASHAITSAMEMIEPAEQGRLALLFEDLDKRLHATMEKRDAASEPERAELNAEIQRLFDQAYRVGWDRVRQTHAFDQFRSEIDAIRLSMNRADATLKFARRLVPIGSALSMLSLFLWYYMHQRHQDALLRLTIKKAEVDLRKSEGDLTAFIHRADVAERKRAAEPADPTSGAPDHT